MWRHRHSAKVVLFEHNSYTVWWTAVLPQSGEGWPKACGVLCSIKFSLNHFLWTLYVNTAFLWLLGIVMSVQVSRFTAQFCKNTERFDLKAIQY